MIAAERARFPEGLAPPCRRLRHVARSLAGQRAGTFANQPPVALLRNVFDLQRLTRLVRNGSTDFHVGYFDPETAIIAASRARACTAAT